MKVRLGWFAILLTTGATLSGEDHSFRLESVGVRGGASKIYAHAPFYQVEAFVNWDLPWRWDYESGCYLQTRLDLTAGWLDGRGDDAFIGTIGPTLVIGK